MSESIRTDVIRVTPKLMRMARWVARAREFNSVEAYVEQQLMADMKATCPDIEQREAAYSKATLEAYNKAVEGI